LIGVCDRVVVLRGGRSVRELDTAGVSEATLLAAAMGEGAVGEAAMGDGARPPEPALGEAG
ncbi:MAG: ribose transport system ATP-binding protein, partial [Pseudonocardiales bacterium]|nr:ribose transport system ATP-binding protein [Pseudonocardiales bacterium]